MKNQTADMCMSAIAMLWNNHALSCSGIAMLWNCQLAMLSNCLVIVVIPDVHILAFQLLNALCSTIGFPSNSWTSC